MITYFKSIIIIIKLIIYNFNIIIIYNTLKMLIQIHDIIFIFVCNYHVLCIYINIVIFDGCIFNNNNQLICNFSL